MYLSRIQINPQRRGARKLLGSPQAMHAAVLAAFPQTSTELGRVLWRVDDDEHRHWLYVLSPVPPDFSHIVEQAGWPSTDAGWQTRPYEKLLNNLATGQKWVFRLTANPTRTSTATGYRRAVDSEGQPSGEFIYPSTGEDRPSKRHAHSTVAHQLDWLLRPNPKTGVSRAERWGFEIPLTGAGTPDVVVHDRRVEHFGRTDHNTGSRGQVTIAKATYGGILEITDVDAFRAALVGGMGPAKGYGCGLLTLAPLS